MSNTETERAKALRNIGPSSIVTVDNVPAEDVVSLKVYVDPVQDLHGYDHPWPEGGGKNLLPKGVSASGKGISFTVLDDGTITANGTATGLTFCNAGTFTLPAGTYILNGCPTNSNSVTMDIRNRAGGSGIVPGADTGNGLTFTLTEETSGTVNIRIPSGETVTNMVFKPMIRLSTVSDAAFAPYSNECPISGWTGCNISHSGEDTSDPTVIPISWQSEAGTVYGGTLDVTTGLLTVDRASKTFDGSETWEWYSNRSLGMSDVSGGVITDRVTQYNKCVTNCDLFKTESWTGMNRTGTVGMFYGQSKIYLKYDGFTSADDIKTFLAANPMTIVYLLATPQTYQLTPTQIALLEGANNVWADCGDILKMRYWSYDLLLNKVVYDNNTLIDLTGDTVTPEVMLAGYTAHDATGSEIEGNIEIATMAEVQTYFGLS